MHQWIEYSLVNRNGEGIQPYQSLVPFDVSFEGGHYVENGRYRGKLTGTPEEISSAIEAIQEFSPIALSDADMLIIAEKELPTNTEVRHLPTESIRYLGPPSIGANSTIVRALSAVPF
jgi:hypothetical protein